ncbi:Gfo/Idh/MocA family protein [Actinomarinicola tropica]|uniref:Gfo/Idh/MocA family oxidoreductase n=1 Tax=Actinomarinicola tropica TaxID=2789776 RepID=A0A5Q2RGL6_9ACTN|nr:Gfo/Idh/MocA family oxidoreductase [Actinomarinicola tropica]QGG95958.1 hypothetical protein GH723_13090 [Actinomarinicola tropica]
MTTQTSGEAVRIGIIGCGDIARRVHVPALSAAGARVIRFASTDIADAEEAARRSGQPDSMTSDEWRHVTASVHIDAVDICTPNHLHADMAMAAMETGKHVLVESPMALTAAQADAMLKVAARKGVTLVPAMSVRFIGPYAAMIDAARSGAVGEVRSVEIAFGHHGPERLNPGATWYLDKEKAGGGPLMELGTSQIDLLRTALEREVVQVSAVTLGRRGGVEERAEARLTFEGGASAQLRCGWTGPENLWRMVGTDGTLELDASTPPQLVRPDGTSERLAIPEVPSIEGVFVAAVARGEQPPVTAMDGRAAVAVIEAAYASSAAGEPVEVTRPAW